MTHDFEAMRDVMVESQLRTNAVSDLRVVKAMAAVPRETFMPEDKAALAYAEILVPLSGGRQQNLPLATGRMLSELAPHVTDRMLIIGSATGYTAAVSAHLAGNVVALEEDAALSGLAREKLMQYGNVECVEGPLNEGAADGAPYDIILIDGMIEQLPDAITDQLADGGRLGTAILDDGVSRLSHGRKHGHAFGMTAIVDVEAAILPGFERTKEFAF